MGGDDCSHCASQVQFQSHLRSYGRTALTADQLKDIFHQPCSICTSSKFYDETLCSFCEHLRFRHLVTCIVERFNIHFNALSRSMIEEDEFVKCSLCRTLRSMILKPHKNQEFFRSCNSDYGIVLGLTKSQEHNPFRKASLWKISQVGRNLSCDFSQQIRVSDVAQGTVQYYCLPL